MIEAYQTYATYDDIAEVTRAMVQAAAVSVFGSTTVEHVDGSLHDLGGEWRQGSLFDHQGNLSAILDQWQLDAGAQKTSALPVAVGEGPLDEVVVGDPRPDICIHPVRRARRET